MVIGKSIKFKEEVYSDEYHLEGEKLIHKFFEDKSKNKDLEILLKAADNYSKTDYHEGKKIAALQRGLYNFEKVKREKNHESNRQE